MCGRYSSLDKLHRRKRAGDRKTTKGILISLSLSMLSADVQTIAKTYVDDSPTLTEHIAWAEIATLSRIVLALSFNPTAALDAQLFLPDLFHIITLLVGYGPVLMRQTIYGLTVNTVQSLATSRATGDMDTLALQRLLEKVQSKEVAGNFGLVMVGGSFEPIHVEDDVFLSKIEDVTKLLGEVLIAGAVSFGQYITLPIRCRLTRRLRKRLASKMDEPGGVDLFPAQSGNSTSSVHCAGLPGR